MKFYKYVDDGYIVCVGTGGMGEEIGEDEYNEIMTAIQNKPMRTETNDFRLKEDLTWEEYETEIPEPGEDINPEEIADALEEIV